MLGKTAFGRKVARSLPRALAKATNDFLETQALVTRPSSASTSSQHQHLSLYWNSWCHVDYFILFGIFPLVYPNIKIILPIKYFLYIKTD